MNKNANLRYRSHPWHGVDIGKNAPNVVTSYIEIVPTDTVKYEIDKKTGYLKIDRPQKYSNVIPALYGFIPQTYSGEKVSRNTEEKTGLENIIGDEDPIDICVLTVNTISHGDILVQAIPIGGFRMLDHNESDDKIIAVLKDDAVFGKIKDISECPSLIVDKLKHYFLTYKDLPDEKANVQITHTFGQKEAYEIILYAMEDYHHYIENIEGLIV